MTRLGTYPRAILLYLFTGMPILLCSQIAKILQLRNSVDMYSSLMITKASPLVAVVWALSGSHSLRSSEQQSQPQPQKTASEQPPIRDRRRYSVYAMLKTQPPFLVFSRSKRLLRPSVCFSTWTFQVVP